MFQKKKGKRKKIQWLTHSLRHTRLDPKDSNEMNCKGKEDSNFQTYRLLNIRTTSRLKERSTSGIINFILVFSNSNLKTYRKILMNPWTISLLFLYISGFFFFKLQLIQD